jgi:phosphoribosylglycinamide formyltransferase-1
VLPGDTEDSLSARVLAAEHRLYPHALQLVASGAVRVEGEIVARQAEARAKGPQAALFSPSLDEGL